ncbi:MAG TPA: thioredoxin family protein [Wenzhouxiangella sp.]|nr:thioredoxin family protein [Wenzhouxiangella sp.]
MTPDAAPGFLAVAALALAGGALLNFMPCVFPVLSLKALELTRTDKKRRLRHGLAYSAGVVCGFAGVAAVLLVLRAGGQALGWGFQLQSPLTVALLALLFFALALSLSGLFEWRGLFSGRGQALTDKQGAAGSFFTGVLACVVASPCTAPAMGIALGAAALMPGPQALSIYVFLGAGMAAPMLALSLVPGLLARLPAPGPWMITLQKLLAFPLYLTVVWLLWVLGRLAGADAVTAMLLAMVLLALVLWLGTLANRSQTLESLRHVLMGLGLIGVLAGLGAAAGEGAGGRTGPGEPFSRERLAELRADPETAVLVNVGADWCLTCQVNERVALETGAVQTLLEERRVVYMKADWTRRDEDISRYLAEFDRNSLPFYLLYPRDGRPPERLPLILRPATVRSAVEALDGPPSPAN